MKKIEEITIEVAYRVSIGGINVPDKIYNGLLKIEENGRVDDSETLLLDGEVSSAWQWLTDNVNESDAMNWSYEVFDIEE